MRTFAAVGLVLCWLSVWPGDAASLHLYVATNGNDSATGSLEAPLRTLARAREEIRRRKDAGGLPPEGAIVTVGGGRYELAAPLEFSSQDGGTAQGPVIYRAETGAEVRLSGGTILRGWQLVTNQTVLQRLEASARGKVWACDVRAQGVTNFGTLRSGPSWGQSEAGVEVFFRDEPMTLARWPNDGSIQIAAALGPTSREEGGHQGKVEGIISVRTDRLKRWGADPDIMAHGYWFFDWADQRQRVESVDASKGIITLAKPYHSYGYRAGQWFYIYNLLSELDRPGEWYLDRARGILYFWPPAPLDSGVVEMSRLPRLITLENVSHLSLEGFLLEAASGMASASGEIRTAAVAITGGTNVTMSGSVIRDCGSWAVIIKGGAGHRILDCDVYQMGDGGVWLEGGDRLTLTPAGHVVENCHIHHFSRWNPVYNPAVRLRGVGNRAAHNLIHDAPHMAMDFGGNDHTIEFNEIHDVVRESNDAGAIYTGRDWSMRGHVIRYNYLHDISGRDKRGCVGVYLDDCFSSAVIFGNVFCRVTAAAFIGGGRDCVIANNLFVDCAPAVHVDARGLNWYASGLGDLSEKLERMPYGMPPWSDRYPQLRRLLADEPMAPKGDLIATNVGWGGKWAEIESQASPFLRMTNNLVQVDPQFVSGPPAGAEAGASQFRLRANSPVWRVGFQPIPVDEIGMQRTGRPPMDLVQPRRGQEPN